MYDLIAIATSYWFKFFFLLTPFSVVSVFLSLTSDLPPVERRAVARRTLVAVVCLCLAFYLAGGVLFRLFGITIDAFRIGAGALLFLSALTIVRQDGPAAATTTPARDLAVVPLAIPLCVGPGTIGALLVMGNELPGLREQVAGALGMVAAAASAGGLLLAGGAVQRLLGERGVAVMAKVTGLFLAALAAQLMLTGVRNLLVV